MSLLTSNLLAPGTKFVVTDDIKDSTFGPGTAGIMSYIEKKDVNFENVAHALVTIIRRGKGGMGRLNLNKINFPIFFNERMLEHEDYLPISGKSTGGKYHVNIEVVEYDTKDLRDIPPLDFLGWAYSYVSYMKYIVNNKTRPSSIKLWPQEQDDILNVASNLPSYYEQDKRMAEKSFGTLKWRTDFIREIKKMESHFIRCVLSYKKGISDIAMNAAEFIKFTNESYYKVADEKSTDDTLKFCQEKNEFFRQMISNKEKNVQKTKKFI